MKRDDKEEIRQKDPISNLKFSNDQQKSSDDYNFRINSSTYSEKKSKSSIEASEIHSFDEDLENGLNIQSFISKSRLAPIQEDKRERTKSSQSSQSEHEKDSVHNKVLASRQFQKPFPLKRRFEDEVSLSERDIQQFGFFKSQQIKEVKEEENEDDTYPIEIAKESLTNSVKKTDRLQKLNQQLRSRFEMRADKPALRSLGISTDFSIKNIEKKKDSIPTMPRQEDNKTNEHFVNDILSNQNQKEIKYLQDLNYTQKIQIVALNCQEALILSVMLSNALISFSLFSLVAVGTSLVLMLGIEINGGETGRESLKTKSFLIMTQIVFGAIVIFGKSMAIIFWKDSLVGEVLMKNFGFCFQDDKNIDVFQSIIFDILIVVLAFIYKIISLRYEQRSLEGNLKLKRVYFKIVPISRQRALEQKHITQERFIKPKDIEQSPRRFSAKKALRKIDSSLDFKDQKQINPLELPNKLNKTTFTEDNGSILGNQSIENTIKKKQKQQKKQKKQKHIEIQENENTKKTTHSNHQQILGHSYFGDLHLAFYFILCFFILIDSAVMKAAPQLFIFMVVMMQAYWVSRRDDFTHKQRLFKQLQFLNFLESWSTFFQVLQTAQLVLQFTFQINFINEKVSKELPENFKFIFVIFGLLKPQFSVNWKQKLITHVVLTSISLAFGQLFKQGLINFETEKFKKLKEIESLKAEGSLIDQKNKNQEMVSNKKLFLLQIFKYLLLIVSILFAYIYHTWPSIIMLLWACHSNFDSSIRSFGELTWYGYCPCFIFVIIYFYAANIYIDHHKVSDKEEYGFFEFQYFILELLIMQAWYFWFIFWVYLSQKLKKSDENYGERFLVFAKKWTNSKDSFSLQNIILITMIPLFQYSLYSLIFYLGILKVDLNHVLYLIFFVMFLTIPNKQRSITKWILVSCCLFIFIKYLLSLIIAQNKDLQNPDKQTDDNNQSTILIICQFLGFQIKDLNHLNPPYLRYTPDIIEFLTFFVSGLYYFIQQLVGIEDNEEQNEKALNHVNFNPQSVNECYVLAQHNLSIRYKTTNKVIQFLYNFKRALFLYVVLTLFYTISLYRQRSLVTWLFLIFTNLLFYLELTIDTDKNPQKVYIKIRAWQALIFYSALVILGYIVFLYLGNFYEIYKWKKWEKQPKWLFDYSDLIGFKSQQQNETDTQFLVFFPFFVFLIFSNIIKNELKKWKEYDEVFKNDLQNLNDKDNFSVLNFQLYQSPVIKLEHQVIQKFSYEEQIKEQLADLQNRKEEIGLKFNKIRFSPLYQAYTIGDLWKFIDIAATYYHLIVQISIFLLILYWWLNIALCLQVFSFVIFNLNISKKMFALRDKYLNIFKRQQLTNFTKVQQNAFSDKAQIEKLNKEKKDSKKDETFLLNDCEIIGQVNNFDEELKKNVIKERYSNWHRQLVLIQLTLIITCGSFFLEKYLEEVIKNQDEQSPDRENQIKKILYYGFVSGVYIKQTFQYGVEDEFDFVLIKVVYGYLILLVLYLIENILLKWLENRFGCDKKAYKAIDQFQIKLKQIDSKIEEIKKILGNIELIEKRRKMKFLNEQKNKIGEDEKFEDVIMIQETEQRKNQSNQEDLSFDFNNNIPCSSLGRITHIEKKVTQKTQKELQQVLLVEMQLSSKRGLKMLLENVIVLILVLSAIGKTNIISLIYFFLILFQQSSCFNTTSRIRVITDTVTVIVLIRLMLFVSNIEMNLQPMEYPNIFNEYKTPVDLANNFYIPWLYIGFGDKEKEERRFNFWYFLALTGVKDKMHSMNFDICLICVGYIYYMTSMFYSLDRNFKIEISEDTIQKLDQVIQFEQTDENLKNNKLDVSQSENQSSFTQMNEKLKKEKRYKEINKIRNNSNQYRMYKFFQRCSYSFYTFVLGFGLFLSLASQTIFSIPLIMFFSITMIIYKYFLNVKNTTKLLKPMLSKLIVPLILLEIFLHLLYQVPDIQNFIQDNKLIEIFNIKKYWRIELQDGMIIKLNNANLNYLQRTLGTKAILLFLINIQISILESKSFFKLKQAIEIGKEKGKAIIFWANNLKIKSYLKYQMKNLKKEQMIVRVKTSFDSWRALFEAKFREGQREVSKQLQIIQTQFSNTEKDIQEKEQVKNQVQGQLLNNQIPLKKSKTTVSEENQDEKIDSLLFQSVNSEFMALHKWQLKVRKNTIQMSRNMTPIKSEEGSNISQEDEGDDQDKTMNYAYDTDYLKVDQKYEHLSDKIKQQFKEIKRNLPFCARQYLKLRKWGLNPILFVNNKNHINEVIDKVKTGETKILTSIESAILDDIRNPQAKKLPQQLKAGKMFMRYAKLLLQLFESNSDHIAYLAMILQVLISPGILTVIYPFAVFGYALIIDPRPTKYFWQFIIIYTQILMLIEFILSLQFMSKPGKNGEAPLVDTINLQNLFNQYYLGLNIIQTQQENGEQIKLGQLLQVFLPKVIILYASVNFIHGMIILQFYEKKDEQQETITDGYVRYIQGQYQCDIDQIDYTNLLPNIQVEKEKKDAIDKGSEGQEIQIKEFQGFEQSKDEVKGQGYLQKRYQEIQEFNYICIKQIMNSSIDDFNIDYYSPNSKDEIQFNEKNRKWDDLLIDKNCLIQYNQDLRPFMSDYDPFEAEKFKDEKYFRKLQAIVQAANNDFVEVRKIILEKPQQDNHQPSFFQNVFVNNKFMVEIFPPLKIQKPGKDFYQATVVVQIILLIIILMFYNRMEGESQDFIKQWNTSNLSGRMVLFLIVFVVLIIIDRVIYKSKTLGTNELKKISFQKQNKISQLFAQNQITVRNVSKFWFQWFQLILLNVLTIWYFPSVGNQKNHNNDNLSKIPKENESNNMNKNPTILIFYFFTCAYFYLQALQIRYGQPEILSSYFMMGQYHWLNKFLFLIFYNIPFMFELRTFIDWLIVKSSLDVFQWIKLAQVQVDLYKTKANNKAYKIKPVGQVLPKWWRQLIGLLLIGLVLGSVFLPMFLFSSLNIFGQLNPVTQLTVTLNLIVDKTSYKFYQTSQTLYQKTFNETDYKLLNLTNFTQTQNFVPNQVQVFMMNKDAQDKYQQTKESFETLNNALANLLNKTKKEQSDQFKFELKYQFTRNQPAQFSKPEISQAFNFSESQIESKINFIQSIIKQKIKSTDEQKCESSSLNIGDFYPFIQLMTTSNNALYLQSSQMIKLSKEILLNIDETCDVWSLSQKYSENYSVEKAYYDEKVKQNQGISFFVFSNYSLPSFLNYNLITFYIVIIYTIAKLIRLGFVPVTSAIFVNDAPDPDDLLDLCEIIHLFRMKEMFQEEEELYFLMIDIMRSPEIFKKITGTYKKQRDDLGVQKIKKE